MIRGYSNVIVLNIEWFFNNNERIHADLLILKYYFWELMRIPRENVQILILKNSEYFWAILSN